MKTTERSSVRKFQARMEENKTKEHQCLSFQ